LACFFKNQPYPLTLLSANIARIIVLHVVPPFARTP
jgi:hypothetical protein